VKAGYGNLEQVKRMTPREFVQALAYEGFLADFDAAFVELNK